MRTNATSAPCHPSLTAKATTAAALSAIMAIGMVALPAAPAGATQGEATGGVSTTTSHVVPATNSTSPAIEFKTPSAITTDAQIDPSNALIPVDEVTQDSSTNGEWQNLPSADDVPTPNPAQLTEHETAGDVEAVLPAITYARAEKIFGKLKPAKAKKKVKTLVVRVQWAGNGKDKSTTKQFRKLATRADKATRAASRGKYGISMTVTPWAKISRTSCTSYSTLAKRALAAAGRMGSKYNPRKYNRVVVYFKHTNDCFWAGLAQTPGTIMWLNGSRYTSVFVHELAHTYGAGHANYVSCTKSRTLTTKFKGCRQLEYGDIGDLMGAGPTTGISQGAISTKIGWLAGSRTKTARKKKQTVKLTPRASSAKGVKAVKVTGKKSVYWVEYRTQTGMDKVLTKDLTGVTVNIASGAAKKSPFVLDMQPQNGHEAVALPIGASWTSPDGVRIKVKKLKGKKATVVIQRRTKAAKKPKASAAPALVAGDEAVRITMTKGNDKGAPIQRWEARAVPADGGLTIAGRLNTGAAKQSSGVLTGLRNGIAYQVSVRTFNEKGWSPYSAASVVTPRPGAPVISVTSPANGQAMAGAIAVNATATAVGVGSANLVSFFAYLDLPWSSQPGYLSQQGNARSFTINRPMPLNNLADGTYPMRFVATDSLGRTAVVARTVVVTGQSPKVTGVTATISGNTLTVKYTPQKQVNDMAFAVVYVQRKANGSFTRSAGLTATSGVQTTWTLDMSGQPAGEYLVDILVLDENAWPNVDFDSYPLPQTWGFSSTKLTVVR